MMPRASVPESQALARRGSILVIDDEEIMREILETLLTREGYEVRLASTAAEGLEHARSVPFDAAIVDMMMPGMDGISALDELKKIDDDMPVLMITAFASVENAIAAMKRGAYDYITKPFKNDEVLVVLRNAMAQRRLVAENRALKQNLQARSATLHAIEEGNNETAQIADLISTAVLRRHLETMDRLGIEYDFLPRESEILHLQFWDAAFAKLKESSALTYEPEGKNKGCWVMRRAGTTKNQLATEGTEEDEISEQDQKVIVRSNGTVGYVGKDIAYHMWKFGLLGRDFQYRKFYRYPNQHDCWISTEHGEEDHPHFGDVAEIYNVIDARQAEAQNTVIEALRALGHNEAADRYTHFSYEMVALTPRCAAELGYQLNEEDKARPWIEVSGRKGFGVKADDLMDALIASGRKEVDSRHPEISEAERAQVATQIAIGALRFFMLKYTKSSVIAFDFKDALSFEGETGPYVQYAVVRATNIFRKGGFRPEKFAGDAGRRVPYNDGIAESRQNEVGPLSLDFGRYFTGPESHEIWELWLTAAKTSYVVSQCIATTEPAYLAKHAFQLAQMYNTFYHRHPILAEADESRKLFLLTTAALIRRELMRVLAAMGINVPGVM